MDDDIEIPDIQQPPTTSSSITSSSITSSNTQQTNSKEISIQDKLELIRVPKHSYINWNKFPVPSDDEIKTIFDICINNTPANVDELSGICNYYIGYNFYNKAGHIKARQHIIKSIEQCYEPAINEVLHVQLNDDLGLLGNLSVWGLFIDNLEQVTNILKKLIDKGYEKMYVYYARLLRYTSQKQESLKYYRLAKEKGCKFAIVEVALWLYSERTQCAELQNRAEQLLLSEISEGNEYAMYVYAWNMCKDDQKKIEYYFLASRKGHEYSVNELIRYYSEHELDNRFLELISNKSLWNLFPPIVLTLAKVYTSRIDSLELHYKYAPGGEGYAQAKKDFDEKIKNKTTH